MAGRLPPALPVHPGLPAPTLAEALADIIVMALPLNLVRRPWRLEVLSVPQEIFRCLAGEASEPNAARGVHFVAGVGDAASDNDTRRHYRRG